MEIPNSVNKERAESFVNQESTEHWKFREKINKKINGIFKTLGYSLVKSIESEEEILSVGERLLNIEEIQIKS